MRSVFVDDGIKGGALTLEADPVIESGACTVVIAHVPFSDVSGFVTTGMKHSWKGIELVALFAPVRIVENFMVMRVKPCQ